MFQHTAKTHAFVSDPLALVFGGEAIVSMKAGWDQDFESEGRITLKGDSICRMTLKCVSDGFLHLSGQATARRLPKNLS